MLHHGQWGVFRVKNATIYLHILLWYFYVIFHHKIVFFSFLFHFLIKSQISATEY